MSRSAEQLIYGLSQVEHIPDSRIARFVKYLKGMSNNPEWHCRRLAGFGGSESGALLRHAYGAFFDAPGDSFKTAPEIVAEKLLAQFPKRPTLQAQRGTDIEALIRAVFHKKYHVKEFSDGFTATQAHSKIPCLLGNIDDSVCSENGRPILVDYKSSQNPYDEKPFDYVVQMHHYEAIARSNDFSFSKGVIVGLHAPEVVLQSLADISRNREQDPELFKFWVDTIVQKGMPGVELKLYPVEFDSNLIAVLERTLPYLWDNHVLKGKLLKTEMKSCLPEETTAKLDRMMGEASQLLAMKGAIETKLSEKNSSLQSMLLGVDHSKLSFTKKHPINIGSRTELDIESAKSALEAAGVVIEEIKTKGKTRDPKKVEEALVALGGDIDSEALLKDELPVKTIRAKLLEHDIDPSIYESKKYSFSGSKQKKKAEQFQQNVEHWECNFKEMIEHDYLHSPAVEYPVETMSDAASMDP